MTNSQAKKALKQMIIQVDTRERETARYQQRLIGFPCRYERIALKTGDYTCCCSLPDGSVVSLGDVAVIERKDSIDELITCLSSKDWRRFSRELQRAKDTGTHLYILVESEGGWADVIAGRYRSRFKPAQLIAAINSLRVRYGVQLDFCRPEDTGLLIYHILRQELKAQLLEL